LEKRKSIAPAHREKAMLKNEDVLEGARKKRKKKLR